MDKHRGKAGKSGKRDMKAPAAKPQEPPKVAIKEKPQGKK